jgi:hypothetical protein
MRMRFIAKSAPKFAAKSAIFAMCFSTAAHADLPQAKPAPEPQLIAETAPVIVGPIYAYGPIVQSPPRQRQRSRQAYSGQAYAAPRSYNGYGRAMPNRGPYQQPYQGYAKPWPQSPNYDSDRRSYQIDRTGYQRWRPSANAQAWYPAPNEMQTRARQPNWRY